MPSITFDLETVTPLFLAGADRATAELRPPTFRGALRYWFRAIAASITTFDEVKKWENKVFGSTDACGAVIIRVQAEKTTSIKFLARDRDNDWLGLSYLLFSMYKGGSKEARACFPPGSRFKVILQTRLSRQEDLQCLHLAIGAMCLLVNLGSVGSRSNRGGGNIKVNQYQFKNIELEQIKFQTQDTNLNALPSKLTAQITSVKHLYPNIISHKTISLPPIADFDILHRNTVNIYLWQLENSGDNDCWDELLDNFGIKYQNFRRRYKQATYDDYSQVKNWIKTRGKTSLATVKRAAFGLPIEFYFTSLPKPNNTASLKANNDVNRSASPLHFKILPLADEEFAILLIYFKTKLIQNKGSLVLTNKNIHQRIQFPAPNQSIIDEFIATLSLTGVIVP